MENQVLIETKRLKKYFAVPAGFLHAVDDVNLTINKGETLGIVGESGCGKSTLGRVILRLHEATSGDVLYDGMDINNFSADEMRKMRQNMQIIFQDPYASLNPRMTIGQIIEEPLKLHKIYKTAEEIAEKSINAIERMLEAYDETKLRIYIAEHEGQALAAAIATNIGGELFYVYGASSNEKRNLMPNYAMQMAMIRWGIETGCKTSFRTCGQGKNLSV